MLPDNKHRKKRLERLKIFTGTEHPYEYVTAKEYDLEYEKFNLGLNKIQK